MLTRLEAVVFDLDGLILDTETPDYLSWKEVYRQHGLDLSIEDWAGVVGRRDVDLYAPLRALGVDMERMREARHRRVERLMDEYVKPLPGFSVLFGQLTRVGIPLGLASNSGLDHVQRMISGLGLTGLFEAIVTADDEVSGKPAPDIYRLVVSRLGADPARTVGLEDSHAGIQSAKSAGLCCIAVPNLFTPHHDLSGADLVVRSLEEIALDVLERVCRIEEDTEST